VKSPIEYYDQSNRELFDEALVHDFSGPYSTLTPHS
jgi:hypothetical protein